MKTSTTNKWLTRLIIFVLLSVCVAVVGSIANLPGSPLSRQPTATIAPNVKEIVPLMLKHSDVPSSWYDDGEYFDDSKLNAKGLYHGFKGNNDPGQLYIHFTQHLSLYATSQDAENTYIDEIRLFEEKPDVWHDVPGLVYQAQSDRFRFACMSTTVNAVPLQSCRVFQVYGKYLSLIFTNIDGQYITFEQVEAVLKRIDDRLVQFKESGLTPEPATPSAGNS